MVKRRDTLSGLEDMLGEGVECPMEPPRDMDTWNNILRQIGNVYVGVPLDALKEYVTNAADAGATEVEIILKRKGKKQSIQVRDNGHGMHLPDNEKKLAGRPMSEYKDLSIEDDSILRLPKSIGESAKRGDVTTQGHKAIGALAWQSVANKVTFISKKDGRGAVAWACSYDAGGESPAFSARMITEEDKPGLVDLVHGHGTTVVFEDVNSEVIRQLHPRLVKRDFGSRFRELIKNRGVKLTVSDETGRYVIEPEEYQGKVVVKETVDTKYGSIDIEIYFNPSQKGIVHVKQGIQTLIEDISIKKSYLGSDAWSSSSFVGQIKADWVTPAAGRQDMENDDRSVVFFETVREFNPVLEEAIKSFKRDNDPVQKRHFYNKMTKAFAAMLRDRPELADILNSYRYARRGETVPGQPTDGYAPPIPTGPGLGTGDTTPRPPRGDRPDTDPDPRLGQPIDSTQPGNTTGRQSFTLRFIDEPLGRTQLSDFEEELSLMKFNNSHSSYLRAVEDPTTKKMYLTALVGKELLSRLYKNSIELADEIIKFQQTFLGYFKL